jgi:4-hydroxy-tetrahydrodipicolinate synthase
MVQAYEAGQPQRALEIHLELLPLFKVLFVTANPIPVKIALESQGWMVGSVRSPLCAADEKVKEAVRAVLQNLSDVLAPSAQSVFTRASQTTTIATSNP